jgi:hypothetical protein
MFNWFYNNNYSSLNESIMRNRVSLYFATLLISAMVLLLVPLTAQAGDGPYVVRGNQHMLIGIVLDEAAVRAALPKGLEPADGMTGGINVYKSGGGEGVAAFGRSYIWVDLKGFDSISGSKARYILWSATSTGLGKLKRAGYLVVKGDTVLKKDGAQVSGSTVVDGKQIMKTAIKLADDKKCGPATGSLNYPILPDRAGKLMMIQYTFIATICGGASPVAAEIMVDADHPLAKFKPTKMTWAAFAPDLSFAGSPMIPIKMASE